jgi:hypothetical protein
MFAFHLWSRWETQGFLQGRKATESTNWAPDSWIHGRPLCTAPS